MTLRAIPPSLMTLFADFAQQVRSAPRPAAVYQRRRGQAEYLYAKRRAGVVRRDLFIGRADDPAARREAETLRHAAAGARERRATARMLKLRGLAAPTPWLGRLLDALDDADLFGQGALLVGTAAYQLMEPLTGFFFPRAALMTTDIDLATATLALRAPAGEDFAAVLAMADPTYAPVPALDRGDLPARFRAADGHLVDLLTPVLRRSDRGTMALPGLGAGATPLQHLDWLIEDPVETAALWHHGVRVRLPQPARYAVHKLILAQRRDPANRPKRGKDLDQARTLIAALKLSDPYALEDALAAARDRGERGWRQPIGRSLAELGETEL